MSEGLTGEVTKFESLQPGTYMAEIVGIEKKELKFGSAVEFSFKLLDLEENLPFDTIRGTVSFKDNRIDVGGKLYKWLSYIGGKELDLKEKIDISKFVGKKCEVLVENKPGKKEGQVFSNVKEVLPSRKKKEAPQSEKKADEEFAPDNSQKPAEAKKEKEDFNF